MSDRKTFFSAIGRKLSILAGGAAVLTSGSALASLPATPQQATNATASPAVGNLKPLPAKLTLKQQRSGFKMIANHTSHSSHASHASHSSHSSRAS